MKSVMQLITFLFSGLGKGIDTIKSIDPKLAISYLNALKKFTYIAIGVPVAFVGLGFVLYWVSLLGQFSLSSTTLAWLMYGIVGIVLYRVSLMVSRQISSLGKSPLPFQLALWLGYAVVGFIFYRVPLFEKSSLPLSWLEYMRPLWRISMLLGGVSALGFVTLLAVLAVPIGALVAAATAPPQSAAAPRVPLENLPWYRWFSPIGILREFRDLGVGFMQSLRVAIERYIEAVRFVLVVAGFGLFFFAALPWPSVTLFLFCLVGTWTVWLNRAYKTTWSRLAQAGAIVVMAIFALALILSSLSSSFFSVFPKIEPEKLVLGGKEAKEFTNTDLESRWGVWAGWIANHWVGIAIAFGVVLLITYLLVRMSRKTPTATQTATSGKRSGWLVTAAVVAFLILCVALIAKTLIGADAERSARIEREIQVARANHEARAASQAVQSATLAAQAQQRQAAQQAAAQQAPRQQELWHGLISPKKYTIVLSTSLSERIPRPNGFSTRTEPRGLRYELWANGQLVPQSSNGPTDFPPNTTFIQYRWTNPPMNVIVGVGKEVK